MSFPLVDVMPPSVGAAEGEAQTQEVLKLAPLRKPIGQAALWRLVGRGDISRCFLREG